MSTHHPIENYYERLLEQAIQQQQISKRYDPDSLAEFRCTVLNQLPAKYIRARADTGRFQSPGDAAALQRRLQETIDIAHALLAKRESA